MEKILFGVKSGNQSKETAFEYAVGNIFPNDDRAFVYLEKEFDVRPLTKEEVKNGAEENARRLAAEMRKQEYGKNSFAISIQKGTNLGEEEEDPRLLCAVVIQSLNTNIELCTWSDEVVALPVELKALVADKVEIYEAYKKFYGERLHDGVTVYELQTGVREQKWIRLTIEKALIQLKERIG